MLTQATCDERSGPANKHTVSGARDALPRCGRHGATRGYATAGTPCKALQERRHDAHDAGNMQPTAREGTAGSGRALGKRRARVRAHACAVQVQTDSGWDDFDAAIDAQAC